jgi:hypothetical protein
MVNLASVVQDSPKQGWGEVELGLSLPSPAYWNGDVSLCTYGCLAPLSFCSIYSPRDRSAMHETVVGQMSGSRWPSHAFWYVADSKPTLGHCILCGWHVFFGWIGLMVRGSSDLGVAASEWLTAPTLSWVASTCWLSSLIAWKTRSHWEQVAVWGALRRLLVLEFGFGP